MALGKYTSIFGKFGAACIVILFFASFGKSQTLVPAFHGMWALVSHTLTHQQLWQNYYGVTPIEFWYSIRLILAAVLFAVLLGSGLAIWRVRLKNKFVRSVVEVPSTVLEAIPEPLYILLTVIIVLFLLERFGINLPAFPVGDPTLLDTVIPAIALGLPAAFFLSRVLVLQLRDETHAPYVTTAVSKGRSGTGAFYQHVMSNIIPTIVRQLPALTAIVISSALFAEFMLGYQGALFYITLYGFGWMQKASGLPAYEPGVTFLIGLVLVGMWALLRLVSEIWTDLRYPSDIESVPAPSNARRQAVWIVIGICMILAVVVCTIDPRLVTANGPNQRHLMNWKTVESAPFGPSREFPLGTDFLGRDLLARSLQGTFATLAPAMLTTLVITLVSALLSAIAVNTQNSRFAKAVRAIGEVLSGMPAFYILLLAMLHRGLNTPFQELIYFAWIAAVETGRGAFTYLQTYQSWFHFGFVEGAVSIGRSRFSIIFTHFRKWLRNFSIEFAFNEFSRILSLMTMLAVFQIFATETLGWPEFTTPGLVEQMVSGQNTWFSIIGDAMWNGGFMENAYYLYAPTLLLLLVTVGANLIARGLKGRS
jgi:peptide/nickel transport system permease protein